jgi:putative membrane protein
MRSHIMMAALLLAPGAMLMAQDTSSTQMPQRDTVRGYNAPQSTGRDALQGDNALLTKIHKINQMEIKAGQLAQRNSTTAKVKSYGQQLVRDHQAADQKITALAQRAGVTFPREQTDTAPKYNQGQRADTLQAPDQEAMQEHGQLQRLGTLQGAQFDAEFANFMAQGHDKAIKMLERAQTQVQNAELRTLIQTTLPTLRVHLQVAQSLGGSTVTTATSSQ